MVSNDKVHLTIQMDLDLEHMLENSFSLEQLFNWSQLQYSVVVGDITLHVEAPKTCAVDACFHLPCGYYGTRLRQYPIVSVSGSDRTSATISIIQTGNPFSFLKTDDDVIDLVDLLIDHTSPAPADCSSEYQNAELRIAETMLLQACCYYLRSQCIEADQSFYGVSKLLYAGFTNGYSSLGEGSVMDILFEDLREATPTSLAVFAYDVVLAFGSDVAQRALPSCIHRLESISEKGLRDIVADMQSAS